MQPGDITRLAAGVLAVVAVLCTAALALAGVQPPESITLIDAAVVGYFFGNAAGRRGGDGG